MSNPGRRLGAAAGSLVFLLLAPGLIAGVVPAWITSWDVVDRLPFVVRGAGVLLMVLGASVLIHAFARFALEGLGTPAPVAPTQRLVVGGLYRYVRNPMYLAVLAVIAGQALLFGSVALVVYGAVIGALFVAFVRVYEEPTLRARYGEEYDASARPFRAGSRAYDLTWFPPWKSRVQPSSSRTSSRRSGPSVSSMASTWSFPQAGPRC